MYIILRFIKFQGRFKVLTGVTFIFFLKTIKHPSEEHVSLYRVHTEYTQSIHTVHKVNSTKLLLVTLCGTTRIRCVFISIFTCICVYLYVCM